MSSNLLAQRFLYVQSDLTGEKKKKKNYSTQVPFNLTAGAN